MEITFSVNNGEEIMILPVAPPGTEIAEAQTNQSYDTVDGQINLIGQMELKTLSISSFFPVNKNYPWVTAGAKKDGWEYVAFFTKWRKKQVPLRLVITGQGRELLNMACTVDNFSYAVDRAGDITYTLDIREYRFVI